MLKKHNIEKCMIYLKSNNIIMKEIMKMIHRPKIIVTMKKLEGWLLFLM